MRGARGWLGATLACLARVPVVCIGHKWFPVPMMTDMLFHELVSSTQMLVSRCFPCLKLLPHESCSSFLGLQRIGELIVFFCVAQWPWCGFACFAVSMFAKPCYLFCCRVVSHVVQLGNNCALGQIELSSSFDVLGLDCFSAEISWFAWAD